jgi:hypothetical protein
VHVLAVDDGELWELDRDDTPVPCRTRHIPLTAGHLIRRANGSFYLRYRANISCTHGDGTVWFDVTADEATNANRAIGLLRPNLRPTGDGMGVIGKRSDTEAAHRWYLQLLPDGRLAYDDPLEQAWDYFAGALATNAITWAHRAGIWDF